MESRTKQSEADKTPAKGGVRGDDARPARRGEVAETAESHQDALLDEGIEETFPASDPVSVKRIT